MVLMALSVCDSEIRDGRDMLAPFVHAPWQCWIVPYSTVILCLLCPLHSEWLQRGGSHPLLSRKIIPQAKRAPCQEVMSDILLPLPFHLITAICTNLLRTLLWPWYIIVPGPKQNYQEDGTNSHPSPFLVVPDSLGSCSFTYSPSNTRAK